MLHLAIWCRLDQDKNGLKDGRVCEGNVGKSAERVYWIRVPVSSRIISYKEGARLRDTEDHLL